MLVFRPSWRYVHVALCASVGGQCVTSALGRIGACGVRTFFSGTLRHALLAVVPLGSMMLCRRLSRISQLVFFVQGVWRWDYLARARAHFNFSTVHLSENVFSSCVSPVVAQFLLPFILLCLLT